MITIIYSICGVFAVIAIWSIDDIVDYIADIVGELK
jgi:hypothetical protein